ncbi:hypothetical protein Acr_00g0017060 [Actinidia rufa]|uniref:Uncharacterized protein n=1 Tax=Actinidia rufa TaxID=165716 RepID=A0A7J0DB22_9ERIC|nr:hypothetical protein Acr_00g0017060 [Actinidia rufa]
MSTPMVALASSVEMTWRSSMDSFYLGQEGSEIKTTSEEVMGDQFRDGPPTTAFSYLNFGTLAAVEDSLLPFSLFSKSVPAVKLGRHSFAATQWTHFESLSSFSIFSSLSLFLFPFHSYPRRMGYGLGLGYHWASWALRFYGLDPTISPSSPLEGNLKSSSYPSRQLLIQLPRKICKTASEIPYPHQWATHFQTEVLAPSHLGALLPLTGELRKVHHFASRRVSLSPSLCTHLKRSLPLIKSRAKETRFGDVMPVDVQLFKIDFVSFLWTFLWTSCTGRTGLF